MNVTVAAATALLTGLAPLSRFVNLAIIPDCFRLQIFGTYIKGGIDPLSHATPVAFADSRRDDQSLRLRRIVHNT